MARPLTIRVLGAGVAGLAATIALAHDGHRVELIDERFAVPTVGTALGLFPPAQAVLDRLGVLDRVRDRSAMPRRGRLLGASGEVLAEVPAGGGLLVSRSDLVSILQEALPAPVRLRRARVTDVRPLRRGADLLVGADGAHSLVRRSGWPGSEARSHHRTVLRGTAEIPPPEVSETWGRGWLVGITPLPGERTNWFACLPEHRTSSREEDLAHLREMVGGRRREIDAVLSAAHPESTLVHGIHTAPAVVPVREDVVLLGDAAHAMAPNLGHGANTALQDAGGLASALEAAARRGGRPDRTGSGDVDPTVARALRSYALRRTVPGQAWRLGSTAMLELATMDRAAAVRNRLLGGRVSVSVS